ncbi:MAG: hypothetical protein AB9M53_01220 [Leptothrix sp. (in: b-proteobacteria)]
MSTLAFYRNQWFENFGEQPPQHFTVDDLIENFYEKKWFESFGVQPPKHLASSMVKDLFEYFEDGGIKPEEVTKMSDQLLPYQYLSEELQIAEWIKTFRIFDSDGSGKIDPIELKGLLVAGGLGSVKNLTYIASVTDKYKQNSTLPEFTFEDVYFMGTGRQPDPTKYDPAAITAGRKPSTVVPGRKAPAR